MCEVQLIHHKMLAQRTTQEGHAGYNIFRAAWELLTITGADLDAPGRSRSVHKNSQVAPAPRDDKSDQSPHNVQSNKAADNNRVMEVSDVE